MADEECGCVGMTLEERNALFNQQMKTRFGTTYGFRFDGSTPETVYSKGCFYVPSEDLTCCELEKYWKDMLGGYFDIIYRFILRTSSRITCSNFIIKYSENLSSPHLTIRPGYQIFYTLTTRDGDIIKKL